MALSTCVSIAVDLMFNRFLETKVIAIWHRHNNKVYLLLDVNVQSSFICLITNIWHRHDNKVYGL